MGYWGRGRVWARLCCAGAWEVGMAAPAPNLFCREKMRVSRACWAGEERAEPRHQQKKHLGTPSEGEEARKEVLWTTPSILGGFAALQERKISGCCCLAARAPLLSPAKVATSTLAPVLSPGGGPEAKGHT